MEQEQRSVRRRTVAKGAAWAVPVITVGAPVPAIAASPIDPCNDNRSSFYLSLYSPPGSTTPQDRPDGQTFSGFAVPGTTCTVQDPVYRPLDPTSQWVSKDTVGLTTNTADIAHIITDFALATDTVTLTLAPETCCVITRIVAHVHKFTAPTDPDCPDPYYQEGGSAFLDVTGLGTKQVSVTPSARTDLCSGFRIHWGSPNDQNSCQSGPGFPGPNAYGQPYGAMLVELLCEQ